MTAIAESTMERIASETAKKTVHELFLALGVNVSTPDAVIELQKDFASLRENRLARLAIRSKAVMTIVSILVTGFITTLWLTLKGTH
jgi:hypothetical protein